MATPAARRAAPIPPDKVDATAAAAQRVTGRGGGAVAHRRCDGVRGCRLCRAASHWTTSATARPRAGSTCRYDSRRHLRGELSSPSLRRCPTTARRFPHSSADGRRLRCAVRAGQWRRLGGLQGAGAQLPHLPHAAVSHTAAQQHSLCTHSRVDEVAGVMEAALSSALLSRCAAVASWRQRTCGQWASLSWPRRRATTQRPLAQETAPLQSTPPLTELRGAVSDTVAVWKESNSGSRCSRSRECRLCSTPA